MPANIGHSSVNIEVFSAYVQAVQLANQRAANFAERSLIMEQLARATMPAEIVGRATVFELGALPMSIALLALKVIRDRQAQLHRAETAAL